MPSIVVLNEVQTNLKFFHNKNIASSECVLFKGCPYTVLWHKVICVRCNIFLGHVNGWTYILALLAIVYLVISSVCIARAVQ